jgi:hypothetical protein
MNAIHAGCDIATGRTASETAITAVVNYLGDMDERPVFHVFEFTRDNLRLVPQTVLIRNARRVLPDASLDREGFCLVNHRSRARDLRSRRAVYCVYRQEIEQLVRELTGCQVAVAEPLGALRSSESAGGSVKVVRHRPVRFVHGDFTDASAAEAIRSSFAERGIQLREQECRCAVYHVWRSLTPAPQYVPLAFCDPGTLEACDCVAADTVLDFPGSRRGRTEASLYHYNAAHTWYYFPDLAEHEALVFKGFDSDTTQPCRVPHTAFDLPGCPTPAPPRVSLDMRVFAMF